MRDFDGDEEDFVVSRPRRTTDWRLVLIIRTMGAFFYAYALLKITVLFVSERIDDRLDYDINN